MGEKAYYSAVRRKGILGTIRPYAPKARAVTRPVGTYDSIEDMIGKNILFDWGGKHELNERCGGIGRVDITSVNSEEQPSFKILRGFSYEWEVSRLIRGVQQLEKKEDGGMGH